MTHHRLEEPGGNGTPVPRDMPDQQAGTGEDPWDVTSTDGHADDDTEETPGADDSSGDDVPDTDEAGTGRRGASRTATPHPEHPDPDESPG